MIDHTALVLDDTDDEILIEAYTPFGKEQMRIGCSMDEYLSSVQAYEDGAFIQEAFHFLSPGEREFLISGINEQRWNELTADDPERVGG